MAIRKARPRTRRRPPPQAGRRASYTESAWNRLAALRAKHDPDGVFFDYFEGLSPQG